MVHGDLEPGSQVTLERSSVSYPPYFPDLIHADDAVVLELFDTEHEQDQWVADQIATNLTDDEIEADGI